MVPCLLVGRVQRSVLSIDDNVGRARVEARVPKAILPDLVAGEHVLDVERSGLSQQVSLSERGLRPVFEPD